MDHSHVSPAANEHGQGLVEYLVIVALMGVATIAIVRTMNEVLQNRFIYVSHALQGDQVSAQKVHIDKRHFGKRDLGDFMKGSGNTDTSGTISTSNGSGQ